MTERMSTRWVLRAITPIIKYQLRAITIALIIVNTYAAVAGARPSLRPHLHPPQPPRSSPCSSRSTLSPSTQCPPIYPAFSWWPWEVSQQSGVGMLTGMCPLVTPEQLILSGGCLTEVTSEEVRAKQLFLAFRDDANQMYERWNQLRLGEILHHSNVSDSALEDARMVLLAERAFNLSLLAVGPPGSVEPFILLARWEQWRHSNLSKCVDLLTTLDTYLLSHQPHHISSRYPTIHEHHFNSTLGSHYLSTFSRLYIWDESNSAPIPTSLSVESMLTDTLAVFLYHLGRHTDLDQMNRNLQFDLNKWRCTTQLKKQAEGKGDLLLWREAIAPERRSEVRHQLNDWKIFCMEPEGTLSSACSKVSQVLTPFGFNSQVSTINPDLDQLSSNFQLPSDDELLLDYPNLLAFARLQAGQPERIYLDPEEETLHPHDTFSQDFIHSEYEAVIRVMRFYYLALNELGVSGRDVGLFILDPQFLPTLALESHSDEFFASLPLTDSQHDLYHSSQSQRWDVSYFDLDTLVLPQCAQNFATVAPFDRDSEEHVTKGQGHYWTRLLPGAVPIKGNVLAISTSGAHKLLRRRTKEERDEAASHPPIKPFHLPPAPIHSPPHQPPPHPSIDRMFLAPPLHCHFSPLHPSSADLVLLIPSHPILSETMGLTALTRRTLSAGVAQHDRNRDGIIDARDVRTQLIMTKIGLERDRLSQAMKADDPSPFPQLDLTQPPNTYHWFSIHSFDTHGSALCLRDDYSMGHPRWARWSDECSSGGGEGGGIDAYWIARRVTRDGRKIRGECERFQPNQVDGNLCPPSDDERGEQEEDGVYLTLESSRGLYLTAEPDGFLRLREAHATPLHTVSEQEEYADWNHSPCSIFRFTPSSNHSATSKDLHSKWRLSGIGHLVTCYGTTLQTHRHWQMIPQEQRPRVRHYRDTLLPNRMETIIPARHAPIQSHSQSNESTHLVHFTSIFRPKLYQSHLLSSARAPPPPRILWALWVTGESNAPSLMQFNVKTWHAICNGVEYPPKSPQEIEDMKRMNQQWRTRFYSSYDRNLTRQPFSPPPGDDWFIQVVDLVPGSQSHLFHFVPRELLPPRFLQLSATNQADLARQLLLLLYGGVWLDISILLLQPPELLIRSRPSLWNSFFLHDRSHSYPHFYMAPTDRKPRRILGKRLLGEFFQGVETWASGAQAGSIVVAQNYLVQARSMVEQPTSFAIWLLPVLRDVDTSVFEPDWNYFRMNLLFSKTAQDDVIVRALLTPREYGGAGLVTLSNSQESPGGYHWLEPFITPDLPFSAIWDFYAAIHFLTDPAPYASDPDWVKRIVANDSMIEIPTAMAWTIRTRNVGELLLGRNHLGALLREVMRIGNARRALNKAKAKAKLKELT